MKLKYDNLLSSFAFNFKLRRYTEERAEREAAEVTAEWVRATQRESEMAAAHAGESEAGAERAAATEGQGLTLVHISAQLERVFSDRGCA